MMQQSKPKDSDYFCFITFWNWPEVTSSDQLWQVKTMIEQLITKMQDQVLTLLEVMRFMKDRKVLRWVIALFLVL